MQSKVCTRQICLFACFLLPVYKLVETPSLLARYANDDLLLPAILHFLLQGLAVWGLLFLLSKRKQPLFDSVHGIGANVFFALLALVYAFVAILPILDLEKFTYAVFYDTAPTLFSFAFFFLFSAYLCVKPIKTVARIADLTPFLFLAPFLLLIFMSLTEADFSNLLPVFHYGTEHIGHALKRTLAHFSDALILFPLLGNTVYKKGDSKKILTAYAVGALITLLFFSVFFGIFSSIAPKQHYAFAKIAQYFPTLAVVGRFDLLLVYLICIPLFFCTALPLFYTTECCTRLFGEKARLFLAVGINLSAFLFTLFCNRFYDSMYVLIGNSLFFIFPLALLPAFLLFRVRGKRS